MSVGYACVLAWALLASMGALVLALAYLDERAKR